MKLFRKKKSRKEIQLERLQERRRALKEDMKAYK